MWILSWATLFSRIRWSLKRGIDFAGFLAQRQHRHILSRHRDFFGDGDGLRLGWWWSGSCSKDMVKNVRGCAAVRYSCLIACLLRFHEMRKSLALWHLYVNWMDMRCVMLEILRFEIISMLLAGDDTTFLLTPENNAWFLHVLLANVEKGDSV